LTPFPWQGKGEVVFKRGKPLLNSPYVVWGV
jgi:hypothetical protein